MTLIDKAALLNTIATEVHYDSERPLEMYAKLLSVVNDAPTVDAEPVRHGRWIEGNNFHWYYNSCSCCGYTRTTDIKSNGWNQWKYCPMCGAKMDESKEQSKGETKERGEDG